MVPQLQIFILEYNFPYGTLLFIFKWVGWLICLPQKTLGELLLIRADKNIGCNQDTGRND